MRVLHEKRLPFMNVQTKLSNTGEYVRKLSLVSCLSSLCTSNVLDSMATIFQDVHSEMTLVPNYGLFVVI